MKNALAISASMAVAVSLTSLNASGQSISLDNTPNQSVVEVISTFDTDPGSTVDANVNSLPYTTASTATDSTVSSTVTPNFLATALSLSFSQSTPDKTSVSSGEGTVYFTALNAATYSISGSMTMVDGPTHTGGELDASLYDETTSTYLYAYDDLVGGASSPYTLTLNSSGGSLTGSLTPGNVYEFDAYDALDNNQGAETLSGTTTLALTQVPEPSAWALTFESVSMLAGFRYFARKSTASARA